ncbi:MAG: hypothetical protein ACSHWW_02150 [Nonlabens sp.]|uniref:hypothetical protein n=1 Tax=Nonlabens sp. TaxID=1888209 RepID=UPI003EF09B2F
MKQIKITNNKLTIHAQPAALIVTIVLGFLLFMIAGLMTAIFLGIFNGGGFHFSYLIGLGILGLLGWHFIRMFLWNRNGKEILTIEDNKLKYIADYGKFKDGAQEMNLTKEIKAVINNHHHRPHKSISFEDVSESQTQQEGISSVIKLKYSENEDFYKLEHDLNVWLMKFRD